MGRFGQIARMDTVTGRRTVLAGTIGMDDKSTENEEHTQKFEYRAPTLREFGSVSDLTQSGTGATSEPGGFCRIFPNRPLCTSRRA